MKAQQPTLLIVDDEERTRKVLKISLSDRYRIFLARDGKEALTYLAQEAVNLVLTDLRMPEMGGMDLLKEVQKRWPQIPVIIVTAFGTVENAVEAIKKGAYDYILKPIKIVELELLLQKALNHSQLLEENVVLKERLKKYEGMPEIISSNPAIVSLLELIKQVAPTDATCLIEGESGTGKALFARAVHSLSPRSGEAFIDLNCGAIPGELLESELFGHERGAFTGAVSTKRGKFEMAHNGTLFLDEIGEMPLDLQVKLLHVLEEQKFTRLGGTKFLTTNARIVAATNRNLQKEVAEGGFRQDLFYRLKVVYLHIPALRERREDIPLLVNFFIGKHRKKLKKNILGIEKTALEMLQLYDWPGNVRELENAILQAMIFTRKNQITADVLPKEIRQQIELGKRKSPVTKEELQKEKIMRTEKIISDLEYRFLDYLLQKTRGNISEAARTSGYDRRQIQNLLKKHKINPENFK